MVTKIGFFLFSPTWVKGIWVETIRWGGGSKGRRGRAKSRNHCDFFAYFVLRPNFDIKSFFFFAQ